MGHEQVAMEDDQALAEITGHGPIKNLVADLDKE